MTLVNLQLLLVLGLIGAAVASQPRGQCEDATDGMYSYGNCSEAFFACSGGRSIEMFCPAGLYFDETRQLCDYSDAVAECETSGSGSGEEGETPKSLCVGVIDGMYSYGNCSEAFFACSGGRSIEMFCPAGLYFDETRQLCDYSDAVAECETSGSGSGEEGETPKSLCVGVIDGMYSYGNCSETFFACVAGHDIEMFCPAGLSFDGTRTLCDYSSAVAECDAGEGSGSGDEEQSGSGSGEEQEASGLVLEHWEASRFSETFTGSGEEGSGEASGTLIEGSGEGSALVDGSGEGSGTLIEASGGIEQSEGSGMDASAEEIGSGYSELLNESTSEDQLLSTPEALSQMLSYCAIHGDGFHSLGCTTMMISCRNGFARRLFCPKPTVWDDKRSVCNYRQDVDGCPASTAKIDEAEDSDGETFACRREGIFSESSCTDEFVLCTDGKGYRLSCDVGLLYSRVDEKCIPATELEECQTDHMED